MNLEKITVQVSTLRETPTSYGVLVDLTFRQNGTLSSASRLEWFPKGECEISRVDVPNHVTAFYLTAPKWLLDKKNVNYKKDNL